MKWAEICIWTSNEAIEPVSNILHEAGSSGVVIEDPKDIERKWPDGLGEIYELNPEDYPPEGVNVKAYFPSGPELGETLEQIRTAIYHLENYGINIGANECTVKEVDEEDWSTSWKKYYKPVRVSDHLTITPSWEDYQPGSGEKVIELDPGMAFGTGTHPTTVLCLHAIEKYLQPGFQVADVGTGSGVLSIAAVKLGAEKVSAFDLDPVAVESAERNMEMNDVSTAVSVKANDLLSEVEGPFDLVLANLLADIVVRLSPDAFRVLAPGGWLIASGIIEDKEEMVERALIRAGFKPVETLRREDWVAIVARKAGDI